MAEGAGVKAGSNPTGRSDSRAGKSAATYT